MHEMNDPALANKGQDLNKISGEQELEPSKHTNAQDATFINDST